MKSKQGIESVRNGISLKAIKAGSEKPKYLLKAIKFDLPWDLTVIAMRWICIWKHAKT